MIALTHPATGHQISVDEESADFWKAAGYLPVESGTKKAQPKKAASSKKSEK